MYEYKIRLLSFVAMPLIFVLAGCANTAIPSSVVPPISNIHKHVNKSVYVTISIEQTTSENLMERMNSMTSKSWENLVKQSIVNSQLFSQVYDEPGADFVLNVSPFKMPKLEGFHANLFSDMTLQMESEWILTDADNKIVMREIIKTVHSAGADHMEAFAKYEITKAGLIQKNIREGLLAVSKLNLQ